MNFSRQCDEWLVEFAASEPDVREVRGASEIPAWGIEFADGVMVALELSSDDLIELSAELGTPSQGCEGVAAELALRANGVSEILEGSVLGLIGSGEAFGLFDRRPPPSSYPDFRDRISGFVQRVRRWSVIIRDLEPEMQVLEQPGMRV